MEKTDIYSDMTDQELKEFKETLMDYYSEVEQKGNTILMAAALSQVEEAMKEIKRRKIEAENYNPRYKAFLLVDNGPEKLKMFRYREFITDMKNRYANADGRVRNNYDGSISITDQDEFTFFIEELVRRGIA